ncbi:hypothetical protein MNBD_CPR01-458 [hydrothermal vent metagenome]|uniref:Type IV secretion system coupling protein TraD DNA-binding domain-containing protein n=1 Tax=hydrothermal vent metagenome TaxID=652676 RepID=A0A3B0ULV4_9ZZZZ
MENPERVTYFAATDSRGKRIPFGIKQKDRSRHMYVIGKTGMGKSTMLENMAIQDMRNGEGLALIDPHGGTAEKLLEYIPEDRIDDVVYFAPFDMEQPIAFNVMEDVGYDKRHLVVSGLMATFKKIWQDAWSARMEYILSNTLLALLEYPDATLLGVNRMYTDKIYRKRVVDNIKDPLVKDFWTKEFAGFTDRYAQEATPAIQNKIGQFTSNPLIRNIIGQPKSSFDIRQMMDQKKILIVNLSKGLVGETNMQLLGSMLTTRIFLAAMSRADTQAQSLAKLPNFYFYVDEFQNFANETFAEILSEARKYKLNLVIAHQYIEQMDEQVRAAVFGNVGTTVSFRVGPFDAEVLETVFMPEFTKEDLVNLGFAQIYVTLMIDGVGSRPFSAITIPPIEAPARTFAHEVISASRARFGHPRSEIEEAVSVELAKTENEKPSNKKNNKQFSGVSARKDFNYKSSEQSHQQRRKDDIKGKDEQTKNRKFEYVSKQKSSGDLKGILRTLSQDTKDTKVRSKNTQKESLKNTLAGVLAKSKNNTQNERQDKEKEQIQQKKEAPSFEKRATKEEQQKPFEVPENQLRKILKGEK